MNRLLVHYGQWLFILMALGSIAGLFYAETPFNGVFNWSFRYLTLPILLAVYGYAYWNRKELTKLMQRRGYVSRNYGQQPLTFSQSRRRLFWMTLLIGPFVVFFSSGYVNFLNAFGSHGTLVTYAGLIQDKFETGGRVPTCCVRIFDDDSNTEMTFEVLGKEYAKVAVGDLYTRTMRRGNLGIPFDEPRWKRAAKEADAY